MKLSQNAIDLLRSYFEDTPPETVAALVLEELGAKAAKQYFTNILREKQRDAKEYGQTGEDRVYYDAEIAKVKAVIAEIERQS